ncbi:MAG: DUF885 domain-containing protein [Myxococcota bacterium]
MSGHPKRLLPGGLCTALALACSASQPSAPVPPVAPDENQRFEAFLETAFDEQVDRQPMFQTRLGIKTNYGEWDDISESFALEELERARALLHELAAFDPRQLTRANQLNVHLFERELQMRIEAHRWRDHEYILNQMYGWHSGIPAFLINFHGVDSLADAEAYVARLESVPTLLREVERTLERQKSKGIRPPRFVYPKLQDSAANVLRGRPFDTSERPSPILEDLRKKLKKLELDEAQAARLEARAVAALEDSVEPAYRSLLALLERHERDATTDDGAWKLPEGGAYYAFRLRQMTTTDLDAETIHQLGLDEVSRIHGEMRSIMKQVGFDGELPAFFQLMRTGEQFFLSNDEAGREVYLRQVTKILDAMEARLPEVFGRLPKAPMRVKRVEPFREKTAGKAFYSSPTPDGSRPGTYYVNLHDMTAMPIYQMEALAYHEGLPGHHMQIAISQELKGLPKFRRFGRATAYTEGWGLYAEYLPKEMGMYQDPYADFGRLAMELWRACRLVVDTGIHAKRWTREHAIDYLLHNTPNPKPDAINAIERYIVMPGQATAYKVGMLKILEIRRAAEARQGEDFDLGAFHDFVLGGGPLPLSVLETEFKLWLDRSG